MSQNKYTNGKIYKIVNDVDANIYIGSTCNSLPKRFGDHKKMFKVKPNITFYKHVDDIGGWEHFRIILIEQYQCQNKDELRRREQYWIDQLYPKLNRRKACFNGSTKKEYDQIYCEENREQRNLQKRQHYHENKERINEKVTCECGKSYTRRGKARHEKTQYHIISSV